MDNTSNVALMGLALTAILLAGFAVWEYTKPEATNVTTCIGDMCATVTIKDPGAFCRGLPAHIEVQPGSPCARYQ